MKVITSTLSDVATVFNGKTPSRAEQQNNGYPVLKIKDVDANGHFSGRFESFVEPGFIEKFREKIIHKGDVLVLNAAHNADYVASKMYFAEQSAVGALATGEWLIARAKPEKLDSQYMYYWFTSASGKHALRDLVKGIHLYPKDVARLQIPLPPLPEQRRIAAVLDAADGLRAKRRAALAKLDALLQSVFLEMFGDPVRNERGLPRQKLQDLTLSITDGKHGDCRPSPNSGFYFVSVKDIKNGRIDYSEARQIHPDDFNEVHRRTNLETGDVLITNSGTIGKTAVIVPSPLTYRTTFQKSVAIVKTDRNLLNPHYLKAVIDLSLANLIQTSSGSSQKNLLLSQLREFEIIVPNLQWQTKYANKAMKIRTFLETHKAYLNKESELFLSLQQCAFRGEL